jgi:hypothetical protein
MDICYETCGDECFYDPCPFIHDYKKSGETIGGYKSALPIPFCNDECNVCSQVDCDKKRP